MWTLLIRILIQFKVTLLSMCKWGLRDKRWEVDQGQVMTTFFYCTTFLMLWLIQETGIYTYPPPPPCGCYTSTLCLLSWLVFSAIWVITIRENKHTCKHSEVESSSYNQCTEHHSWICQLVFSPLPVDQHCMRTRTYQRWSPLLQFVLHSMIACWGMYM